MSELGLNRFFVSSLLLAIIVSAMVAPSAMVYAAGKGDDRVEKFIGFAEKARETVMKLNDTAVEQGVDLMATNVPALINSGDLYLSWAHGNMSVSEAVALGNAREAQGMYRDAIKILGGLIHVEEKKEVKESEEANGILVAIDRSMEMVDRLRAVNTSILNTPENVVFKAWFNGNLSEAVAHMTQAADALKLDPPNATWAAGNLSDARKDIAEAFKVLRMMEDWVQKWRVESFLNGVKNMVDRVDDLLLKAADDGYNVTALRNSFSQIKGLIDDARVKAVAGDKKGSIDDLGMIKDIVQSIEKDLNRLTHEKGPHPPHS